MLNAPYVINRKKSMSPGLLITLAVSIVLSPQNQIAGTISMLGAFDIRNVRSQIGFYGD
jgi:hypothetical protein